MPFDASHSPCRIIFFGTAELACASLKALAACHAFHVLAVATQPDKPRGRELRLEPTPVKAAALALGLPVLQPLRARDPAFIEQLRALQPDLMVVVAYGQILPQALLDIPRHGCLNVHTSILPRHRGAAPIQWAILSGDPETGVTIMRMDAGLDTGPILSIQKTPILPADNSQVLHDRLAVLGAELLLQTIPHYLRGEISPQPQGEGATYARKIEKSDGAIQWSDPAQTLWLKIRAFTPWPGAFTFLETDGRKRLIKIWEAAPAQSVAASTQIQGVPGAVLHADRGGILIACGAGALRVTQLQPEGRKRMAAADFLAGHPLAPGQKFTD